MNFNHYYELYRIVKLKEVIAALSLLILVNNGKQVINQLMNNIFLSHLIREF